MKPISGFWNLNRSRFSLGGGLLFLQETVAFAQNCSASIEKIVFRGSNEFWLREAPLTLACGEAGGLCQESDFPFGSLLRLPFYFAGFDRVCIEITEEKGSRPLDLSGFGWPLDDAYLGDGRIDYLASLLPSLSTPPWLNPTQFCAGQAQAVLTKQDRDRKIIAVHLKNSFQDPLSNADFHAWGAFFQRYVGHPFLFVLVGNESLPVSFSTLSNVVVLAEYGLNLGRDLAVIRAADAFLGMATGPCNMALCGSKPYLIFKNPHHHVEEMLREYKHFNRPPFASPHQNMYRVFEDAHLLELLFQSLWQ
ncbi:hypothetical protein SAMN05444156_0963 [Verrucomicrobium sp. GAS474]|uniref:hypothetical protein n=1 Tax=Verrucomicrobium sp. GAS474 TaxID=1882831 RepID=UPI000879AE66|nr:hypothetical protein [Verrucomicrobium sp. GAS474]SDT94556.1 hypothetical protein SAMN05444156_0963 [Verrucomicrobium sp. GAS474]